MRRLLCMYSYMVSKKNFIIIALTILTSPLSGELPTIWEYFDVKKRGVYVFKLDNADVKGETYYLYPVLNKGIHVKDLYVGGMKFREFDEILAKLEKMEPKKVIVGDRSRVYIEDGARVLLLDSEEIKNLKNRMQGVEIHLIGH